MYAHLYIYKYMLDYVEITEYISLKDYSHWTLLNVSNISFQIRMLSSVSAKVPFGNQCFNDRKNFPNFFIVTNGRPLRGPQRIPFRLLLVSEDLSEE